VRLRRGTCDGECAGVERALGLVPRLCRPFPAGAGVRSLRAGDRHSCCRDRWRDTQACRWQDGSSDRGQGADAATRLPRRRSLADGGGGKGCAHPSRSEQGGRASLRRDQDRSPPLSPCAGLRGEWCRATLAPARDDRQGARARLFLLRQSRLREGARGERDRGERKGARRVGLASLSHRERGRCRRSRPPHADLSARRGEGAERRRGDRARLSQFRPRLEERFHHQCRTQRRECLCRSGYRPQDARRQTRARARLGDLAQWSHDRGDTPRADRAHRG
jgi:hypothetical protein